MSKAGADADRRNRQKSGTVGLQLHRFAAACRTDDLGAEGEACRRKRGRGHYATSCNADALWAVGRVIRNGERSVRGTAGLRRERYRDGTVRACGETRGTVASLSERLSHSNAADSQARAARVRHSNRLRCARRSDKLRTKVEVSCAERNSRGRVTRTAKRYALRAADGRIRDLEDTTDRPAGRRFERYGDLARCTTRKDPQAILTRHAE